MSNQPVVQFQDLPPKGTGVSNAGSGKWAAVAQQLRDRPGEWALIANSAGSLAHVIKRGRYSCFQPAGHFEAASRNHDRATGKSDIFARYVGDGRG